MTRYEHPEGKAEVVMPDDILNSFAAWLSKRGLSLERGPEELSSDLTWYAIVHAAPVDNPAPASSENDDYPTRSLEVNS